VDINAAGDKAVVGMPDGSRNALNEGGAFVYDKGAGWGTSQPYDLTSLITAFPDGNFGYVVAISDDGNR